MKFSNHLLGISKISCIFASNFKPLISSILLLLKRNFKVWFPVFGFWLLSCNSLKTKPEPPELLIDFSINNYLKGYFQKTEMIDTALKNLYQLNGYETFFIT